jgi:diacylglycerol kinase family enzyme
MAALPEIDLASPLQFVINAAAGSTDAQAKREVIEAALRAGGRRGDLLFCGPAELTGVSHQAATRAIATRTAVVAVGGDGTLNTVAQAAHGAGCAMGVVPQGTFNYFARTHGIPADPADAVRLLLRSSPAPVQVAGINDRVFLVNASLGLYPDLLEDRETYKARFGRSRWVAFVAACATLLRAQRRLRLHIEMGSEVRDMQTLTLFVGNNRLQLQQFGAEPEDTLDGTPGDGSMAALVLRPIGTMSMMGLMLHGAMGRLGEAAGVERFEFEHLVVRPTLPQGRRGVKVAFDGEVTMMRTPLDFRVLARPLYLLRPQRDDAVGHPGARTAEAGG